MLSSAGVDLEICVLECWFPDNYFNKNFKEGEFLKTFKEANKNPYVTKRIFNKLCMERVMGIEPTLSAWKAEVLPLNYTRTANS